MTRTRFGLLTAAAFLLTGGLYAAYRAQTAANTPDLATWAPAGALLSIESPDFSSLLHDWTASPEAAAWLRADDYAVFSRSHLFARLQDAQKQFASAAGLPVDTALLQQLAGRQTFFAWYNIGQLQLLYITRLSPAAAAQNPLLIHRSQFQTRQSAGITFYVKTSTTPDATDTDESRTVAFALSGDYLLLATGEDLLAHTLELLASTPATNPHPVPDTNPDAPHLAPDIGVPTDLAHQPWYLEARAQAPADPGVLRMTLHLEAIVKTPQFRSYWVQQNITEMSQYRSAVADLYRDPTGFREERTLLPKSTTGPAPAEADLAQLTALVPAHTAIYRAAAHPTPANALTALDEKLLLRGLSPADDTATAPTADLSTPQPGSTTDLETRIDEPIASPSPANASPLLQVLLDNTPLDALMTLDRNGSPTAASPVWIPFTSAVILQSPRPWNTAALQQALTQAMQQRLTAGALGLAWQPRTVRGQTYFITSQAAPLLLAVHGQICILTDDEPLLLDLLQNLPHAPATPQPALLAAGFDHAAAQPAFAHWTATVDGLHQPEAAPTHTPAFFAENLESLSHSFTPLTHETFTAHQQGTTLHQTVTYTFTH